LSDIREQLSEKKTYVEELQIQLSRREEELTHAMMKVRDIFVRNLAESFQLDCKLIG
jgi:hypothetical protein